MISNISTLSEDNNDVSEPKAKLANSSFVENQCYVGNSEGIEPDTTTNTPTQTLKRNTDTTTSIIPEEVKPEKQQLERNLVLAESNSATREEKQFKKKPKRSILDQFFGLFPADNRCPSFCLNLNRLLYFKTQSFKITRDLVYSNIQWFFTFLIISLISQ